MTRLLFLPVIAATITALLIVACRPRPEIPAHWTEPEDGYAPGELPQLDPYQWAVLDTPGQSALPSGSSSRGRDSGRQSGVRYGPSGCGPESDRERPLPSGQLATYLRGWQGGQVVYTRVGREWTQ